MAGFATHDGVELAYDDRGGDGFPLVMLHGWGQTQAMFRHQLSDLAPDRRIVTLDHARPRPLREAALRLPDRPLLARRVRAARPPRRSSASTRWAGRWASRCWWSFIDQYGTDRIRRFVAVDQPAAVAAVPWMTGEEQTESGAIFDVAALLGLGDGAGRAGVGEGPRRIRAQHVQRRDRPGGPGVRARGAGHGPAVRRGAAAVRPLRAGLARRAPAHRRPDARARMRRQPRRAVVTGLHRRADPGRRACTSSRPTWPTRTSRSWRTRPRSTPWSRRSSTGDVVRRRMQDRLDL